VKKVFVLLVALAAPSTLYAVDLKNLTDSVMNGWRADFQAQMGSRIACVETKRH
jgi:hypothetical protein